MYLILFTVIFLCYGLQIGKANVDSEVVVVTNVGTIKGVRASDGNYSMFMGIPYGSVNAANPFGVPIPYPYFDGIFEANDDTKACPQIEEFNNTLIGSPDCLNLNIFVPDSASTENPTAVLVWIYGGLFSLGFASRYIHGPKYLVRHDVILVAINYRLGPYGFMCLHTPEVPGNQGLRDQLLALRWIKNNIAAFGGDPDRVSLFGNSAGGMSADFHALSDQEKLYNGIILQSGTAFVGQWDTDPNTNDLLSIAETLGLRTSNVDEALEYLATFDSNTIVQLASDLLLSFGPCVEKDINGVERIIADNAVNVNHIPKADGLNVIIGSNEDEMMVRFAFTPEEAYPSFQNDFRDYLESCFDFENETLTVLERTVRNFYVGDDDFNQGMINDLADFHSDTSFVYPAERTLARYLENGAVVFYYVFSYNGGRNIHKYRIGAEVGGAYHADEVGYLFDAQLFSEEPTSNDQLIIDRMTMMWANFAKYGDPTPETTPLLPVKWEPVTKDLYHYLNITTAMNSGRRPFNQRMSFWDLFYQSYGQYERTFKARSSAARGLRNIYLLYFIVSVMMYNIISCNFIGNQAYYF